MCFTLSTTVQTPSGAAPLRALAVGDSVIGYDPWRGTHGPQAVRTVVDRTVTRLVTLELAGRAVTVSLEHPFWTVADGFVAARWLRAGSVLLSADGDAVPVTGLAAARGRFRVRNLTVAGTATFFAGVPGVLVHNTPFFGGTSGDGG